MLGEDTVPAFRYEQCSIPSFVVIRNLVFASGSDESKPSRPSVAFSRVPILAAVPVKSHIRESNTHILSVFIAPTSAPRHGGSTSTSLPNITLFTYASSPRFTRTRTDGQGSYGHLWVSAGSILAGPLSVTVSRWM